MVIEHTFVTTKKSTDALREASTYLAARGFVADQSAGFSLDPAGWTSVELRRGRPTAGRRQRTLLNSAQQIRLEYDRGRLHIAASAPDVGSVKRRQIYLTALVRDLEQLLSYQPFTVPADETWDAITAGQKRFERRQKLTGWIVFGLIFALVLAAVLYGSRS